MVRCKMDREILFRAKRIDNGEWAEGLPSYAPDGDIAEMEVDVRHRSSVMNSAFVNIDPETVCQYTGLTDKNGKKIFEGDIIDDIDYGIMKCIYLHGSFVWYKEDGFRIECMRYVPKIEVIGNIFDNPELIGRQHDTNTWVM